MNKLIETLESGLVGFKTLQNSTSFLITSISETPTDVVWVSVAKFPNLVNQIADDAKEIGKVPLITIKEGGKGSDDGSKQPSYKLLARLFHILDDKGNPTGKVVFFSIKGPKGCDDLKKAPADQIRRLKVVFDLGELTGEGANSPLEWFQIMAARAKMINDRQSYINFGDRSNAEGLELESNDLME